MGVIHYNAAPDVRKIFNDIVRCLNLSHIDCNMVRFFRSKGSKSRYTIARIYGLSKIWQDSLNLKPYYVLEVISEKYDKLPIEEKEKTLIHEALHIPHGFKGGFRHHKYNITQEKVDTLYKAYKCSRANRHISKAVRD